MKNIFTSFSHLIHIYELSYNGICAKERSYMSIEVFNRYEKKYILDEDIYMNLKNEISGYMEPDKYNKEGKIYTISNIYYDTINNDLITRSIQKPIYKEKLRLRGYGVPKLDDMVFLEIKKKYDGIVNKRRSSMKLGEAVKMLETGRMEELQPYMNEQIIHEIEYMLSNMEIVPALYLAYDRYAYFDVADRDFRLTFDFNVRSRREDLDLTKGDYGELLFDEGTIIMEMKASNAVPLWFAKVLSKYKLYPVSVSKYGTEFKKKLLETMSERNDKDEF